MRSKLSRKSDRLAGVRSDGAVMLKGVGEFMGSFLFSPGVIGFNLQTAN